MNTLKISQSKSVFSSHQQIYGKFNFTLEIKGESQVLDLSKM
jgi:hypothetical protein